MKKIINIVVCILLPLLSVGQNIELLSSISFCDEGRFKILLGGELGYYQTMKKKNRQVGIIVSYNKGYNEHKRDLNTGTSDNEYRLLKTNAEKISLRASYNYNLLIKRQLKIQLAPELSFNNIRYKDEYYYLNDDFSGDANDQINRIGIGISNRIRYNIKQSKIGLILKFTGTITTFEWGAKSYNLYPWLNSWLYCEFGVDYKIMNN